MNENAKQLLRLCEELRSKIDYGEVRNRLEVKYPGPPFNPPEAKMVEALIFWAFVQSDNFFRHSSASGRDEFLTHFLDHDNLHIRLIAHVEKLPVSVWRKILWKYNIAFASFESFLRRITVEQVQAILANYEDFFILTKVPRVFGWASRLLGRATYQNLLDEIFLGPDDRNLRYMSKGAMSYNLLGLDFGFNAYPGGVSDDTKLVEVSPLRFLSVKNHADDFVVNTEFGKYFWLYRKARANAAYNHGKEVRLKTHICPGFWATLIAHALFWVVSPALLATAHYWAPHSGSQFVHRFPLLLSACVTPVWLATAFVGTLFRAIGGVIPSSARNKAREIVGDYVAPIMMCLVLLVGALVCGFLLISSLRDTYQFLQLTFGHLGASAIFGIASLYLGNKVYGRVKNGSFPKFGKLFVPVRYSCIALAATSVAHFLYLYGGRIWGQALRFLAMMLEGFRMMGWVMLLFAVPFALTGVMVLCATKMEEKKWVRVSKIFAWGINGLVVAIFASAAGLPFWAPSVIGNEMPLLVKVLYTLCWIATAVGYVFAWKRASKEDPRYQRYYAGYLGWIKVDPRVLMQNKWLNSLEPQEQKSVCGEYQRLMSNIFSSRDSDDANDIANEIALKLDSRLLAFLRSNAAGLNERAGYNHTGAREIILAYGFGADSYDAALAMAQEWHRESREMLEKFLLALKIIFYPVILVWKAVCKLAEWAKTIYRLVELFQKRCPYWAKPERIRMEIAGD